MTTRDNEKKSRVSKDFRIVLTILVVIFLGILGRQEYKIYQIQKEAEATQKRVDELQKVQADLEAERKRLYDPKYIEKLAREDHNYVKKDEVPIFIVKDKEKQNA
ncbi:MAG: septum formation initiator family protein, partial [Acidaminococcaceae bacterium]|nr:septum formation initiator family protein [Acidaminococcaceae bacterium]